MFSAVKFITVFATAVVLTGCAAQKPQKTVWTKASANNFAIQVEPKAKALKNFNLKTARLEKSQDEGGRDYKYTLRKPGKLISYYYKALDPGYAFYEKPNLQRMVKNEPWFQQKNGKIVGKGTLSNAKGRYEFVRVALTESNCIFSAYTYGITGNELSDEGNEIAAISYCDTTPGSANQDDLAELIASVTFGR